MQPEAVLPGDMHSHAALFPSESINFSTAVRRRAQQRDGVRQAPIKIKSSAPTLLQVGGICIFDSIFSVTFSEGDPHQHSNSWKKEKKNQAKLFYSSSYLSFHTG